MNFGCLKIFTTQMEMTKFVNQNQKNQSNFVGDRNVSVLCLWLSNIDSCILSFSTFVLYSKS
jgi:hypothetical protein